MLTKFLFAFFVAIFFLSCTKHEGNLSGGSYDTDNVVGRILDQDSVPVRGAILRMSKKGVFRSPAQADSSFSIATSDAKGNFSFTVDQNGSYLIEGFTDSIHSAIYEYSLDNTEAKIDLGKKTLGAMARVVGKINFLPNTKDIMVQVSGLKRQPKVDSVTGEYSLLLPIGDFELLVQGRLEDKTVLNNFQVKVASHSVPKSNFINLRDPEHPFFQWKKIDKVVINSIQKNSSFTTDVIFPMLIRINSETAPGFNFDETALNGEDIRFSKLDGKTEIPFEIESWERKSKTANIWVFLDSVTLNDSAKIIYMYSHNSSAIPRSNGSLVFRYHPAVYHFGEESPGIGNLDLYGNASTGLDKASDYISSLGHEGVVAQGQSFNKGDYALIENPSKNFSALPAVQMSLWFKTNRLDAKGSALIAKGDDFGIRLNAKGGIQLFKSKNDSTKIILNSIRENLADNKWHLVVGALTDTSLKIIVDGVLDTIFFTASAKTGNGRQENVFIGKHGLGAAGWDFDGAMDELRISTVPRSQLWALYEYQSQKPASDLLKIEDYFTPNDKNKSSTQLP